MESLGKYQIVEKIGEGGFGVIFKGFDPFIKRAVAIKTCTSEAEDIRSRFYNEAQIVGNLQHRNITTVYDFGVVEGVPYLVQEYLTGEDLDRKIKRKEFLPYPEKLLYLVQIARGLEFAHSRGVIHRDIKPANIRILEDGAAKIMDFGIAKLAQQESGLTQTGMTLGTAAYLAPEQIRGESVDQRTDIFSYGLLAYELLTYARPFSGQQISTLLFQILNEEPKSIAERWPSCPPELQAVIERCMAKDPARRYPSMTEVLRDLDALLKKRRALDEDAEAVARREPGQATNPIPIAEMATSTLQRSSEPTQLRPTPTPGTPTPSASPPLPSAATTSRTMPIADVGEMELSFHVDEQRKTPRSITTTAYHAQERPNPWPWLGVVAGLLLAVALGWWMATPSAPAAIAPTQPAPEAATSPPTPGPAPATQPATQALAPLPAGTPATTRPPAAGATEGASTNPAGFPAVDAPRAAPAPAVTTPAAPPPPARATVRIAATWSDQIVVHGVGRGAQPLGTRERSFELEPGAYKLMFELLSEDYSDVAELRVTLEPGQTKRIQCPIPRPGQLSVLPFPDTPQGMVFRNGDGLGPTPILGRRLRPGSYTLEVKSVAGDKQVAIPVEVGSDSITTVNFDLTGRRPTASFSRPLVAGPGAP
jgi:serine/threonine-protein kinase